LGNGAGHFQLMPPLLEWNEITRMGAEHMEVEDATAGNDNIEINDDVVRKLLLPHH
jgi:hypothetical protein